METFLKIFIGIQVALIVFAVFFIYRLNTKGKRAYKDPQPDPDKHYAFTIKDKKGIIAYKEKADDPWLIPVSGSRVPLHLPDTAPQVSKLNIIYPCTNDTPSEGETNISFEEMVDQIKRETPRINYCLPKSE